VAAVGGGNAGRAALPARWRNAALPRFLLLYGALYAGFGVQSPYLPALLAGRGLRPEAIATVLAAGTAIRLAAGPAAGRLADRRDRPKLIFAGCAVMAALFGLGYGALRGFWPLLAIGLCQAAALAPLAPLSDTLALAAAAPAAARQSPGFSYGWVRGAGSAAFILGSLASGQAIERLGTAVIVWLNAALLAAAAVLTPLVPRLERRPLSDSRPLSDNRRAACKSTCGRDVRAPRAGVADLLRLQPFRRAIIVAALILGSHAMHDSFAVIRWEAAGISPGMAGLLWSEGVAGEVVVFLLLGRPLLDRFGPAGAATLSAAAGILRWGVMAETASLPAMIAVEPLHGLTFALLHLACMQIFAETVPPPLAATALTLYGTVGIGVATALLTWLSGLLYADFGAHGFWAMAALCAVALPLARGLRSN
jgi:PPP family 3-phenylpropionic acid transporter